MSLDKHLPQRRKRLKKDANILLRYFQNVGTKVTGCDITKKMLHLLTKKSRSWVYTP
jgi:hypothetical protein